MAILMLLLMLLLLLCIRYVECCQGVVSVRRWRTAVASETRRNRGTLLRLHARHGLLGGE